jgi:hypothetical protein
MDKNIKDIEGDIIYLISETYDRGYTRGKQEQFVVNEKLSNPKIILMDFLSHIKKFKLVSYDDTKLFSNGEYLMADESLISNFLLSRDYGIED